jgi:translation initiation factor 2 subunit 2
MSTLNFYEMLDIIYSQIDIKEETKIVLPNLDLNFVGKKCHWTNIKSILRKININPDNFFNYFEKDFPDIYWKTSSKSDGLVIEGRTTKNKIINSLQRYMISHVICKSCKSYDTIIIKDNKKRLNLFNCNICQSSYSLAL